MTENKKTVDRYMEGFRRSDHEEILSCLTDDVEWEIPGAFHARGREEFDRHIEDDGFVGSPAITVTRLTEEGGDVVGGTPEQFAAYIAIETEKWAKVVKAAGVRAE